jgi:hypothetical protein
MKTTKTTKKNAKDKTEARAKAKGGVKPQGGPRSKADTKAKPMSCLDAAAAVLKAGGEPMQVRAMVVAMKEKGLWTSAAPTPWATLYSAIVREIGKKGDKGRFRKTDRGHFALNA